MPEQSPEAIERFILWLYTGQLFRSDEEPKDLNRREFADPYIVGDIYGIPQLQNLVMDCFIAYVNSPKSRESRIPISILHHVYANTPKRCCLQRFVVEYAVSKARFSGDWFEAHQQKYPKQYLMDLVLEFYYHKKGTADGIDWKNVGCRYHVHPKDAVTSGGERSNTSPEQAEERM